MQILKKNKEIKLIPEMLNLLGCNKENFIKVINKMNYKTFEKNGDIYFKYFPKRIFKKNTSLKKESKSNPFSVLKQINFK